MPGDACHLKLAMHVFITTWVVLYELDKISKSIDLRCGMSWYVDAFSGLSIVGVYRHIPELGQMLNLNSVSFIIHTRPSLRNKTQLQEVPES